MGPRGSDSGDSDDEDGQDSDGSGSAAYTPTPSDYVCESLRVGYSEEEVAGFIDGILPENDRAWEGFGKTDAVEVLRRVVHHRTASTAIRPWKGPLPKVCLPSLTLGDFMGFSTVVRRRRKKGRLVAEQRPAPSPANVDEIRAARAAHLNLLLGYVGPQADGTALGLSDSGQVAQKDTQADN